MRAGIALAFEKGPDAIPDINPPYKAALLDVMEKAEPKPPAAAELPGRSGIANQTSPVAVNDFGVEKVQNRICLFHGTPNRRIRSPVNREGA